MRPVNARVSNHLEVGIGDGIAASRHRGIAASRHRGIAASRHRGIAASRHRNNSPMSDSSLYN
jgi:hypothetical protein